METMTVPIFKGEGKLEYEERPIPLIEEADQIAAMLVGLMKSLGWKSPGR